MRQYVRHLAGTLAALCAVQCSTVLPVWAEDITVRQGTRIPGVLAPGETVRIQGEISAPDIRQVTVGIYDKGGTAVSMASAAPFAEVYQLARLSGALSFETLPEGEYLYQVTVTGQDGQKTIADSQAFTVAGIAAADVVYCTEENRFPAFLPQGDTLHFSGKVCSPTPITTLTAVIGQPDGTAVSAVVRNPDTTLCSLERLGDELEIEKLQPGRYVLLVVLENGEPLPHVLFNHSFSVGVGAVPPKQTAPPETTVQTETTIQTETTTQTETTDETLTNPPFPSTTASSETTTTTTIETVTTSTTSETTTTTAETTSSTESVLTNPPFPGTLPSSETSTTTTTATTETVPRQDTMTVTNGVKIPANLTQGDAVIVRGTVQSLTSPLESVSVEIYDMMGNLMSGKSVAPGTLSYDLHELDRYVMFNTLPAGNYLYRVTASNAAAKDVILDIQEFTVSTSQVTVTDPITLTGGMTVPASLSQGSAVVVRGTVQSVSEIRSLTVGVYDAADVMVTGRTVQPNASAYDLHLLDAYITFNTLTPGAYTYRVTGTNTSGAGQVVEEQQFTVTAPAGLTYINGILVVNKSYSVPSSYNPGGLLSEVQAAFDEMAAAARKDGITLRVYSGFRSYARQNTIYHNYCAAYGRATADTFSARPGHSEHQTGMAIDVNCADDSFVGTKEAKWLAENSYKYGFIIRYPEGKQHITGFKYEPWHVRYLGKTNAGLVYQSGLTLEEYLGIDSVYR